VIPFSPNGAATQGGIWVRGVKMELVRNLWLATKEEIAHFHSCGDDHAEEGGEAICPICLDDLSDDSSVVTTCRHCFHAKCAQHSEWASVLTNFHWSCPTCRKIVTYARTEGIKVGELEKLDTKPDTPKDQSLSKILKQVPKLQKHLKTLLELKPLERQVSSWSGPFTWILGRRQEAEERDLALVPAIIGLVIDGNFADEDIKALEEYEALERRTSEIAAFRHYQRSCTSRHWCIFFGCVSARALIPDSAAIPKSQTLQHSAVAHSNGIQGLVWVLHIAFISGTSRV